MHKIQLLIEHMAHTIHISWNHFVHEHMLSILASMGFYVLTPVIISVHTESIEKASAQVAGALFGVILVTIYKTLFEEPFKLWLKLKFEQFKKWKQKRKTKNSR